jgi:RNA polymerase sigma factor (sigma-70 family)
MDHQKLCEYLNSKNEQEINVAFLYLDQTIRIPFRRWSYLTCWFRHLQGEDIDDVYQETMITFYNHIGRKGTEGITGSFKSFIFGIGWNKWREHFRKKKYTEELQDIFELVGAVENQDELETYVKDLEVYLAELPETCRTILELTFWENQNCKQINALVPDLKTIVNCRQRRFECIQKMRKKMGVIKNIKP